jgi:hypothetical protein
VGRYLRRVGDVLDPPLPPASRDRLAPRVRRLKVDLDAADARWANRNRPR